MDLQAIANSIATTIGTVTATNGTATETATCTADLPDAIATVALLVYPPATGTLEVGVSARRNDLYTFMVRLLRDPLSVPSRSRWLYSWFNAIHDLIVTTHIGLGLSYVSAAEAVAMRTELDGEIYSSSATGKLERFDVIELQIDVLVNEHVTGITV